MKHYFFMGILAITFASCGGNRTGSDATTDSGSNQSNSTGNNATGMDSSGRSNGATTNESTSGVMNNGTNAKGTTNAPRGSSDTTAVGTNKNTGRDTMKVDSARQKKSPKH